MAGNVLTPLQLIAGASLLQNQGLVVSPELTASISAYSSTSLIAPFLTVVSQYPAAATLGANTVPAFSNSVPAAYANLGTQLTAVVSAQASADFGSGDISKFVQALNLALAYTENTNIFINSAVNSQTYLGNTFTSTNDMITGDVTKINLATSTFGQDLANLGVLFDLSNLNSIGSPLALIQQLVQTTGNIPILSLLLLAEGVSEDIVLNLTNPSIGVSDSVQRLMYQALTKVTGSDLSQILSVLNITTVNILSMADLLNPVKLFPNSFLSLTVATPNGARAIYINSTGSVNTELLSQLPEYIIVSYLRLQQIIPSDQALANKALSVALAQINGISNINLPTFSAAVTQLETTKDLPLITALEQAVPASVANYYTSTLAVGGGVNGDIRVVDIIGLAAGWQAADYFAETVEIFSTMDLSALTTIYQQMNTAISGGYGDTAAGPLIIPSGPAAGTYFGTEIDPGPPPEYDPTALDEAMSALINAAQSEILNLQSLYPEQTLELNTLWTAMAVQVTGEDTLQAIINLNYADLTANDKNSIYGFIYSLPGYGPQTEEGGVAWFLENMANLASLGGQAVIACLREGRNQVALNNSGIFTNTAIPSDPVPPPPSAELLPSDYTEAEAENLVVR
jgi:hypothetical protein